VYELVDVWNLTGGVEMNDIDRLLIAFKLTGEQIDLIAKGLCKILDNLIPAIDKFNKECELYFEKLKDKIKHKPVLKIYPNKTYIKDKRIVNYYCRNNL